MKLTRHDPPAVHAPSPGYSLGLELSGHSRLLFISGQVPAAADGTVPAGFEAQCEQAWANVGRGAALGRHGGRQSGEDHHLPDRQEPGGGESHYSAARAGRSLAGLDDDDRRDGGRTLAAGDRGDRRGVIARRATISGQSAMPSALSSISPSASGQQR
jgi:hypothetical protein